MNKSRKLEMYNNERSEAGITLVALVVTIVVLLILAGVTITALLGDDGIIKKAQNAADSTNSAVQDELAGMNSLTDKMNSILNGNGGGGDTFEPQPTPEPPTGGTAMKTMIYGIIEIKWLSGTSNIVSESPNAPAIKIDFTDGTMMEQVVFNGTDWEPGTEYSYVAGTGTNDNASSEWANARVIKDGIESYFVWIPRYAYRIIYFDSTESKEAYQNGTLTEEEGIRGRQIIGYSDSRGIVDAQGRKIEEVTSESNSPKLMVSEDYFMVHPAFTSEVENGGWDTELAGIWIGKYEVARSDTEGTTQGTSTTLKVQPGVACYKSESETIGNMYTYAKAYDTNLKSHMLKNSEWGAVAYLTESKYGRNGTEITQNKDSRYQTGGGSGTEYITNVSQSTTGNVYGIYDLSGGGDEYVASYYKGGYDLSDGSSFANGTSNAYSTAYTERDDESAGYKYGDATYETNGWHSDTKGFILYGGPFFERGGTCRTGAGGAGVFYHSGNNGLSCEIDYGLYKSFRLCLVV